MATILVLYAHPAEDKSQVSKAMFSIANTATGVTAFDLYATYPTSRINVADQQALLLAHDVIVFLCPVFWYSTPAILKDWQDLVLQYGFAFGPNGDKLKGKRFLLAMSAGAPAEEYHHDGINGVSLESLLLPLNKMASLCNMTNEPPFLLYGTTTAVDDGRLQTHLQQWKSLLQGYITEELSQ
ncbi:MAG: glutathione-regulated potassium-efflux system ancillary protein KefG [Kiritimatiellia bacterium]|jgi:putative NADPH-quinone reductase